MSNYKPEDKSCTHCGGKLSPHSCGEFGGVKIWCDVCGSNNPEFPPSVIINGVETNEVSLPEAEISEDTKKLLDAFARKNKEDFNVPYGLQYVLDLEDIEKKAYAEGLRQGRVEERVRAINIIRGHSLTDWSGEQEVYEQIEEIAKKVESLEEETV